MLARLLSVLFLLFAAVAATAAAAAENAATAAPYEGEMQRLAEILGALQYLRGLCGSSDGQTWRNEMQALMEAETPPGERRDRLIASFNRGYRGFQQSHHSCTPAANLAIRRYLDEGARISRDITARYAN